MRIKYPLLFLCSIAFFAALAQTAPDLQKLDATLMQLHRQAMFNGVALVADKGKVVYQKNFGTANIATGEPLSSSSSFNMASVAKQFVTMMVMMLKEQGKLSYDDAVTKFIPELPYQGITLRHLMTHTSGLPEYFDLVQRYTSPLDTITNARIIQLLSDVRPPLDFPTGSKWEYCNTGYALLATVIERAAGVAPDIFFQQRIAGPLKFKNTLMYNLTQKGKVIPNRVFGFSRENGQNISSDLMRMDGIWGDGNVYASADDLLKWDQALYTEKLVKQSTLKEAFTPVKLNDGTTYPYGFGWGIERDGKRIRHTGSWVGFRNAIIRDVDTHRTVIILSNGNNGIARNIAMDVLDGKSFKIPQTKLFSNVVVVDGTGAPAQKISVRLADNRIWESGMLMPFENETVIDGKGKTLAPGFIDSHSHHDWGMDVYPDLTAATSQGITTIVVGQDGGGRPIDSIRAGLTKKPIAINLATYTGHTTLRFQTMGTGGLLRTSRKEELEKMKELLKQEMEKGSLGLATGLEYESAFFSSRDEVLELAKIAAAHGGRYISHIRSEDISMEDALDEIVRIGAEAKLPVQIAHMKIALKSKWGSSTNILAYLQDARASGVDITADVYPYDFWMSTLRVLFPKRDYTNPVSAEFAVNQLFDPEKSVLVAFAPHPAYAGKTVGAVAKLRNEKSSATLMYLIDAAAKFDATNTDKSIDTEGIMAKSMSDTDVVNFLAWPHSNICSDGAIDGHPRGHGAFTRVLQKYVREQHVLTLEQAIYKMTGLTAEHLGIKNRGLIAPGYFADLVLFDPATVAEKASIENPKALSEGIEQVWVNGVEVYTQKKATGKYPGVFVTR